MWTKALCTSIRIVPASRRRLHASSSAASSQAASAGGVEWNKVLKAALTSGSMSALGDAIAQQLVTWRLEQDGLSTSPFDPKRALSMFGFGFCFYGPFQHFWYNALARSFPGTSVAAFVKKVALNQLVLGPIVLTTAFTWTLALKGRLEDLPDKMRRDSFPTIVNGWKFWIPAASVNFYAIPLRFQVLYMSMCGVVWTAYISFASFNSANAIVHSQQQSKR